jgi:hypothetical protein
MLASLHSSANGSLASIPLDISIETIFAIIMICVGLVLGTPPLRPVQWRVWAGMIEREGERGFVDANGSVAKDYMGNPFKVLETRPSFLNIRQQRAEFADWIREGGAQES